MQLSCTHQKTVTLTWEGSGSPASLPLPGMKILIRVGELSYIVRSHPIAIEPPIFSAIARRTACFAAVVIVMGAFARYQISSFVAVGRNITFPLPPIPLVIKWSLLCFLPVQVVRGSVTVGSGPRGAKDTSGLRKYRKGCLGG